MSKKERTPDEIITEFLQNQQKRCKKLRERLKLYNTDEQNPITQPPSGKIKVKITKTFFYRN